MVSYTFREVCRRRVFENRILRKIFRPRKDENGAWRRLHNEPPNTVRVLKPKKLRWTGHVARWKKLGVLSTF